MTRRPPSPVLLTLLLLAGVAVALGACRKKKRNFVPAPKAKVVEPDGGGNVADPSGDGGAMVARGDSDGGPGAGTGNGDGDGDGDGDGPGDGDGDGENASGDLSKAEAQALLAFLENDLKEGMGKPKLYSALARKCSSVGHCADAACRSVLATCSGDDMGGCGGRLQASCPAFTAVAQGLSGDELKGRTEGWLRDLWGDLLVKLRLSLPDRLQDKVDVVAERHQL